MENSYLFVYGTLRRQSGHDMGQWLANNGHYIGEAKLKGELYQVSYYPALVAGDNWIYGDVYACQPDIWPTLDAFEEATGLEAEYERHLHPVLLVTGQWLSAWVYWYRRPTTGLSPVAGGDWLRHSTTLR